jgi:hypothetical protein
MINYPKDENGCISDDNLPKEQTKDFKLPQIIHSNIESFSYLSTANEFKKHIKKLNRQFMLCNIKEIPEIKEYLDGYNQKNHVDLIGIRFLFNSFEVHTFENSANTLSIKEYAPDYVESNEAMHFLEYFKNQDSKAYEEWRRNKPSLQTSELKNLAHDFYWIFFDMDCFKNIITPIIYKEDLALYESIELDNKIQESSINSFDKKKKLKV